MEYTLLLKSPSFFFFLLKIDLTIAKSCQDAGCMHCGGSLCISNWQRVGFGLPRGTSEEVLVRHSFICSNCRRRTTPNSLRWMYYRWFSSPAQFLLPALRGRLSKAKMKEMCVLLGTTPVRLRLRQRWWREEFFTHPYWVTCGIPRFKGVIVTEEQLLLAAKLPQSVCQDSFAGLLRFLGGYRTGSLWQLWPRAIESLWGIVQ